MLRSRRSWAAAGVLALAAAVLTILAGVVSSPARAAVGDCVPGSAWPASQAGLATQVVSLVNSHRASLGLSTLKISPTLTASAVWKARHMAQYQYFQHDDPAPPVARTVGQRLQACGYPVNAGWGENIAEGFQTPADVMTAWLNSAGHKANIENATYRVIGVAAAADVNGAIYWVQDFGTVDDSGSTGGGGGGGGTPAAPTVGLTSRPAATTTATTATFAWTTTGTVASTTCSLDGGAGVSCASPVSYGSLKTGAHTFRVTVSNPGGSASASASWTIGSSAPAPPTITLTRISRGFGASGVTTLSWTTTGSVSSTTCSLDSAAPVACSSPWTFTVGSGRHSVTVTVSGLGGFARASVSWYAF